MAENGDLKQVGTHFEELRVIEEMGADHIDETDGKFYRTLTRNNRFLDEEEQLQRVEMFENQIKEGRKDTNMRFNTVKSQVIIQIFLKS